MAAAGTCTIIEENFSSTKLISWTWIGGTGESVIGSATTESYYTGQLIFCAIVPDSSNAPADGYTVQILDKNDIDLLANGGLSCGTASVETILESSLGACANTQLELSVTNSGSAGTETGVVHLWIR